MTIRERRALVVGGTIVVGATLLLRGVPWVVGRVTILGARARESTEVAARARRLLTQAPALRDSLASSLREIVALAPKLLASGPPAEAQAALGEHVTLLAGQSALRTIRIDPLPDSSAGAFGRVTIRAEMEGDLRGLARFLVATEGGAPVLTVSALGITAPTPLSPPTIPETLRIEATISGLFLRRETR